MNQPNLNRQSQEQDNLIKDTNVGRDLIFAPQYIIKTEIIESKVETITQQTLNRKSPYQGLKKFNFKDRDRFFGRDKLINRLLEAVNQSSLSLVLGASGSGKSSVVRAGLISELKKSLESQTFYDFIFTPKKDPFDSLYQCLLSEEKDYNFRESEAEIALEEKIDTLTKVINTLKKDDERWLIFIDQFEELFTSCDDSNKRNNFIEGLVKVAKSGNSSVKILLAMRSDFLEQFAVYSDLAIIANDNNIHLVTKMYPDELRQVIEQPAARHGVVFEEGLVKQIIKEVEEQKGYLPLLQYTLNLLWESECQTLGANNRPHIEDRILRKKTYNVLEGVRGALEKRVNQIYSDLKHDNKEEISKQIFLKLVNIVDTDYGRRAVSRVAYRNEFIGQLVAEFLNIFIKENLLVSNSTSSKLEEKEVIDSQELKKSATVEITHEILLSSWKMLQTWIKEEEEAIKLKNGLAEEVRRWQKILLEDKSRAKDELLKGSRLDQIVEFRKKDAFKNVGCLSKEEEKFINASEEHRNKEIRQTHIIIIGSISAGLIMTLLAISSGIQSREAQIGQIKALTQSSESKFTLNRYSLDALVDALKAGERLQQLSWANREPQLQTEVKKVLTQAVFWIKERNRLEEHSSWVNSISFSSTGQQIASASGDGIIKIWQQNGKLITSFKGHESGITSVSFSPNGKTLVSGGLDETVKLWKQDGSLFTLLKIFNDVGKVWAVEFSPDGQTFAVAGENNTIKLFQLDVTLNATLIATLIGHTKTVNSVKFSPDGEIIASASDDGTVRFWKRRDGKLIKELKENEREITEVTSVSFSPDSQVLASGSLDGTIKIWQRDGTLVNTLEGHSNGVQTICFSPDGRILASGGRDNTVKIWQLADRTLLTTLTGHSNIVTNVSFSHDGQILGSASNDGSIKLWQLKKPVFTVLTDHTGNEINSISFSPNGQLIAAASMDNTIQLWRKDGTLVKTLRGNTERIINISFSSNDQLIASASFDGTVRLWKWQQDGSSNVALKDKDKTKFMDVTFSKDGQTIVTSDIDGNVKLWRQQDGKLIKSLKGHDGIAYSVRFSPNNQLLASVGEDGRLRLWKIDGTPIITSEESKKKAPNLYQLRFSPNGQNIATASKEGTVKLWKTDGTLVRVFGRKGTPMTSVSFSPDGQTIASANEKGTIFLWHLDGTLITELTGHSKVVLSLSFNPDGKTLASGSDDGSIILWDLNNLNLNHWQQLGCRWIQDYLKNNSNIGTENSHLCTDTSNFK